jgi:hypothetical protein
MATRRLSLVLTVLGLLLLALWCQTWVVSLKENRLQGYAGSFPRFDRLGYDFNRTYRAVTDAVSGRNPYDLVNDEAGVERYNHPPVVVWLFWWSAWLSFRSATIVWTIALAAMAGIGVWGSWRARTRLGLRQFPFLFVLALFLWSSPVLFAMERGNWDLVVASLVLISLPAVRRPSILGDLFAGVCLALAAWIKIFPCILLVGLVALRRWRVAASAMVAGLTVWLIDPRGVREFARNMQESIVLHDPTLDSLSYEHSLTASWRILWMETLPFLASIPGNVAGSVLVVPFIIWAGYRASRCSDASAIVYPLFFWLLAVSCFLLPIAYDYKLVFLLLAVGASWDHGDPVVAHALLGLLFLQVQPFALEIDPRIAFLMKVGGLAGATISVSKRMSEQCRPLFPEPART